MNRGSRVRIEHLRTSGAAACSCGAIHRDSTRERVRQHVAETGHVARFVVEHITLYRPHPLPDEGDAA